MNAIVGLFATLSGFIGDIPKVLAALVFLHKAVVDAEATGQTGEQKLTAVLNDFEAFLNSAFPTVAPEFATIAQGVEAAVNEIVGIYNAFAKPPAA